MKIVYIEWIDSISQSGWRHDTAPGDMMIKSAGILIKETKEFITISTSSAGAGSFESPLSIPKCAISERKTIKVLK